MIPPRETIFEQGTLSALNAQQVVFADGAATLSLFVSGTYAGTLIVEGSIDGSTWDPVPMRPLDAAPLYVLTLASAATGRWAGPIAPYVLARVRMSTWTSGVANVTLAAKETTMFAEVFLKAADRSVSALGTAGAALTLTLPAPGAGLYQYITNLAVQRFAATALTAGAVPVTVTTTNLPGPRQLYIPADAALQGTQFERTLVRATPVRAVVANTATTVVMPATTGVIWAAEADWYNLP
jgi:hypothetical protein